MSRLLRALRENRLAAAGGWILLCLYALTLVGGFVAPYDYRTYDRERAYHPPSRIRFFDRDGRFTFRPFVYETRRERDELTERVRFIEDTERPRPISFFVHGDRYSFLGILETDRHLFGPSGDPSRTPLLYLLGSDRSGRDVLSRLIYGSRVSLTIGIASVLVTLLVGMTLGGISGYFGGRTDLVVQRLCEMVLMLPGFYLLISLSGSIPSGSPPATTYLAIVLILSFVGWGGFARVVRGIVLTVASQDFVASARALGRRDAGVIAHHVLPATFPYGVVAATLRIPGAILAESALSALNLGIREPAASWGNMLADATSNVVLIREHPWMLAPGAAIVLTVLAFGWFGDGLRDSVDPRGLPSPAR